MKPFTNVSPKNLTGIVTPYRVSSTDSRAWIRDILYPVLEAYFLAAKAACFPCLCSLSPPQKPLCVAGRLGRGKRESAWGTMGTQLEPLLWRSKELCSPYRSRHLWFYHWRRLGRVEISTLAVEVRGKESPPLFDLPQLLSILQFNIVVACAHV